MMYRVGDYIKTINLQFGIIIDKKIVGKDVIYTIKNPKNNKIYKNISETLISGYYKI